MIAKKEIFETEFQGFLRKNKEVTLKYSFDLMKNKNPF